MFATVQIASELEPSVLLVPDMAILRSGDKNTVFVALEGGKFDPRTVTLGPQAENGAFQVVSGLKEGELVVTSGQFMLDSESQLREAIQKMREPPKPGGMKTSRPEVQKTPPERNPETSVPAPDTRTNTVKYVCPMPEHVSIQYDRPGQCSICGMTLVPVTAAALQKLQPGGQLLYYTCPMPEHSDVHESNPGKCPKCGMTLIPVLQAPPVPSATNQIEKTQAIRATLYTCPMASHADVVSNQPGLCPKCDMALVPTRTVAHGKIAEENWHRQHPGPSAKDAAPEPH
jgi:rubrerythrin